MITAIDTNVLVALWAGDDQFSQALQKTLDDALQKGGLTISGTVFAELLASARVTENFVSEFCSDAGISIDWSTNENIWKTAGLAYRRYAKTRRRQGAGEARRILTDFIIGAHALVQDHALLTLDKGIYKNAFPELTLIKI